jgi:hypothetical protein
MLQTLKLNNKKWKKYEDFLKLAILKHRKYFLKIKTINLSNRKSENEEIRSLVGLTPVVPVFV